MGLIAIVRKFARVGKYSEATVDPGGGANITAGHFADPGDDSQPLPQDIAAIVPTARTGGGSAVGYSDPVNDKIASPGEKRIYARDASGAVVSDIWLQDDSSIILRNGAGFILLAADGSVNINGVTIDASGNITAPGSLILNGKELDGHIHAAGTPPGNTGPNQ